MATQGPFIIALSGKRFTGKDAFADAFVAGAQALGWRVPRGAFAGECKLAFVEEARAHGREVDLARLLADRAYKEQLRPALTAFTERALARDPLVFVRGVLARVAPFGCGLVTDLRLRAELEYLRAHVELRAVRLERPAAHRAAGGWVFTPGTDDHRTETELDDETAWDATFVNDASLAAWQARAADFAARLYRDASASPT